MVSVVLLGDEDVAELVPVVVVADSVKLSVLVARFPVAVAVVLRVELEVLEVVFSVTVVDSVKVSLLVVKELVVRVLVPVVVAVVLLVELAVLEVVVVVLVVQFWLMQNCCTEGSPM